MRAVDVHVHGREAVGETFGHETLRRQVITLVKVVFAEDVEDTGVTFETGRVQRYAIQQVSDAAESRFRGFERTRAHEPMDFIAKPSR